MDWDELEETLIRADLGVPMSMKILASLRSRDELTAKRRDRSGPRGSPKILPLRHRPAAPVSRQAESHPGGRRQRHRQDHLHRQARPFPQKRRHSVMLAAADTFRAAAIEQLGIWAERIGVRNDQGPVQRRPRRPLLRRLRRRRQRNIEFLICDTAGRLHTKTNLMAELNKMKRTLEKHDETAPHEWLLVVDATTGWQRASAGPRIPPGGRPHRRHRHQTRRQRQRRRGHRHPERAEHPHPLHRHRRKTRQLRALRRPRVHRADAVIPLLASMGWR